jgi:DNA-damage-inducible protein J
VIAMPVADSYVLRIADDGRLPFDIGTPSALTREAMAELESGKAKSFSSIDALMADLHAGD